MLRLRLALHFTEDGKAHHSRPIPALKRHVYPAIPLLGIYAEETIIQKESCTKMFIAALFTIARTWSYGLSVLASRPCKI